MMMTDRERSEPVGARWRWVIRALLPGIASDVMFVGSIAMTGSRTDLIAIMATGLLYCAALIVFAMPFYLIPTARSYVREVHGGYQSVVPFVLMYGVGNFVLWLVGVLLVMSQINWV
jgi:hypothetical protein